MGWDAFGLPAEQYAIRTGQHPRQTTEANIAVFKRQIRRWASATIGAARLTRPTRAISNGRNGFSSSSTIRGSIRPRARPSRSKPCRAARHVTETRAGIRDNHRLAYVTEAPVWWCEQLGTVLANEEVVDGKSEVGGFPVDAQTDAPMDAAHHRLRRAPAGGPGADRLERIAQGNAAQLDRPQRRGGGASFAAGRRCGCGCRSRVFTTRPDTLFGATYMVLSPEHKLVDAHHHPGAARRGRRLQGGGRQQSDLERTELAREKTGVFTGAYAVNPVNNEKIPIWIADYVLASYGTGAIMAVPGARHAGPGIRPEV